MSLTTLIQESLSSERLFLDARILFLITLKPTPFIPLSIEGEVIDKLATVRPTTHGVLSPIFTSPQALSTSFHALETQRPFGREALIDLLKITFNLMTHYPRMDKANKSNEPPGEPQCVLGDVWDDKFKTCVQ